MEQKVKMESCNYVSQSSRVTVCPICGTKFENSEFEKILQQQGFSKEEINCLSNGSFGIAFKLGIQITKTIEVNGNQAIDFTKNFEALRDWTEKIEEKAKYLDEKRKEADEAYEKVDKRKEEIAEQLQKLMEFKDQLNDKEKSILPEEIEKRFQELSDGLKETVKDLQESLAKMFHNPKTKGTTEEEITAKRIERMNLGDKIIPKGGQNEEDVLVEVVKNDKKLGKIVIDSKKIKSWNKKYIKKVTNYIEKQKADVGIISTTEMPKEAIGKPVFWATEKLLVVNSEDLESSYLLARYAIIRTNEAQNVCQRQIDLMKKSKETLENFKKVIERADFEGIQKILREAIKQAENTRDHLNRFQDTSMNYFERIQESNREVIKLIQNSLNANSAIQEIFEGSIETSPSNY